ncbi:MAG: pilus assembly protein PilM [Candidatus Babeliales bacterium]
MIKDLFIPQKIDGYYILSQDILGVVINKTHVRAALVTAQAKTLTIKDFFEEPLSTNNELSYQERVANALTALRAKVGTNVTIRSSLSSAQVTFKQLKLPFADPEKIKMILPFEIAPQLPFAIENAIIDFIVVSVDEERKESTVMVAAILKEHVAQHMALFAAAQIEPDQITIDLFDLYGLYLMVPAYRARKGVTVLLELQASSTRLMYLIDNKLERIRTIGQGIAHLAKIVGQELNIENGDALEQVLRFGTGSHAQSNYTTAMHQAVGSLWQAVQFTLSSFADQTGAARPIDTILLVGAFATLPGIAEYITERSGIPCMPFDIQLLFENPHIIQGTKAITPDQIASLSTALPKPTTENLNMLQGEFAPQTTSLFAKQIILLAALLLLLLGGLLGISIWQTSALRSQERRASKEALIYLQELALVDEDVMNLTQAVEDAKLKLNKQEDQWFPFSRQARTSPLNVLQALSAAMNRESLGLLLKRLVIAEDHVTIEGSVKNWEALTTLQNELEKSKLFAYIPKEEFQDFSTFNVKLLLKKKKGAL